MVKSGRGVVRLFCTAVVLSMISVAGAQDRIIGDLANGPRVQLGSNVHSLARPENDLGRADGNRIIERISLNFRLSAAQQQDLDHFLAELADRTSPNYHKYLTPAQFAKRFGMSDNDVSKVVSWIEAQGFTNVKVAKNRNRVTFDGTVAQIESVFGLEMHHYLADGEVHLANSMNPSVPAALSGAVVYVGHLNDFAPKPRAKVRPNFTSFVSGNHSLTPADFKTIYDLNGLGDGTGQKIAVVGQSTVAISDISNFRAAAGLPSTPLPTMKLMEGTAQRCTGDEGESDLDLEWAGGVAKNASITFVYAGMGSGDTCTKRFDSVWDALQNALETPVAPFVSTSYGFCEQVLQAQNPGFAATIRTSVQNGQALGVTLVSASGDAGAADCDSGTSATQGLAVDVPSSIPETTAMGGTEFSADSPTNTTNNPPGGNPPYWSAAGATSDTLSSALEYVPETAWNDTAISLANHGGLAATGGGASILFPKGAWQGGTGTMRLVPDVSLSASADHDPYLFCSEDDQQTGQIVSTCTAGFRTGAGGNLTAVGGTSVAAPTFAAILALINQFLGTPSLAPVNPTLYSVAASTPAAFHDIKTGNNIVPCTAPSTNCPTGTTQIGFSAGAGYDEVTGLGSVDGLVLAQAMSTAPGFTLAPTAGSYQVSQGSPVTATVNLTPVNGFTGQITYTCTDNVSESTCTGPATAVDSTQAASFVVTTKAPIARLERPFGPGSRIVYATLLPGLLGVVFVASSRKRSLRSVRFLGLLMVLGFSTIWLGSCGGTSHGPKDPGTPVGSYTITVTGTSGSLTRQTSFTLVVVK
ncbi:MAG TPA: S53 family serine peptidase [Candidatus Sulfotelmatobacter sp.]|nr:S53 family serine peptidase [Candidatus Sulfotelmatobacter sp.]